VESAMAERVSPAITVRLDITLQFVPIGLVEF